MLDLIVSYLCTCARRYAIHAATLVFVGGASSAVLLLFQASNQDVTDDGIAKKCLETANSYSWEHADDDKRGDQIRWLAGKVKELEVKAWVTSGSLPRALEAGALLRTGQTPS